MRDEEDVRKRLALLKSRHLQRLTKKRLRRRPCNCQFNREHTFQREGRAETVRLCMLGIDRPDWDVDICETTKQARDCGAYLPKYNRDTVEAEFEATLDDEQKLQNSYRDIYMLKWVLGDVEVKYTLWQRIVMSWAAWVAPRKALPAPEDTDDTQQDE